MTIFSKKTTGPSRLAAVSLALATLMWMACSMRGSPASPVVGEDAATTADAAAGDGGGGDAPVVAQEPDASEQDASQGPALPDAGSNSGDGGQVGATTPFISYEAEDGTLGGGATINALTAPPTTEYSSAELEASGHAYVKLAQAGQYVEWTNKTGKNITAFNVRYSIPDAPTGGGITSTLDLYVNGTMRQVVPMNSIQTWLYEGNNNYNGNDQNPADGDPRVFWDEVHAFLTGAALAPGDTIRVQMDASNTAAYYSIDVIDLEAPPPPITQPANSLSITSCGAVADNNPTNGAADPGAPDSTSAIQTCINMAEKSGQSLWIPEGTFYLNGTQGLQASGITIEGAGMWYSRIYRNVPLPNNVGLAATFSITSCTLRNFATDANELSRATVDGGGGAMDTTGTNWVTDSVWNMHAESGVWASGTGGTLKNSRLAPMWADGFNLNTVSLNGNVGNNLTAENNFVRGTGDDAIAINSSDPGNPPMTNITVNNNTSIAPWGGKGVAIYGGGGHHVYNNYMSDTARYIGLGVGKFGAGGLGLTSATVTGNVVVRCGGNAYLQQQPALMIGNGGDGGGQGIIENATVSNNTVSNALYNAVAFSTATNITLQGNVITAPGLAGIIISPPFYPAPTGSASIVDNTVTGLNSGQMAYVNDSSGFMATLMGNNF
jgi:hypothetical protein